MWEKLRCCLTHPEGEDPRPTRAGAPQLPHLLMSAAEPRGRVWIPVRVQKKRRRRKKRKSCHAAPAAPVGCTGQQRHLSEHGFKGQLLLENKSRTLAWLLAPHSVHHVFTIHPAIHHNKARTLSPESRSIPATGPSQGQKHRSQVCAPGPMSERLQNKTEIINSAA